MSVVTDERGYDLVIHQANGKALSFDATWVALVTMFGTTDATKVWMQMDGMWNKLLAGTLGEAGRTSTGSIIGYNYIIQMTYPRGIDFYFNKK